MAITATTVNELIQSIDTNIRNKTERNSITVDIHSDLLNEVVQVLSANTYTISGEYTSSASTIDFTNNSGETFSVTGVTDTVLSSGVFDSTGSTLTLTSSDASNVVVTGFTGFVDTDTYVTGGTYDSNTGIVTLTRNDDVDIEVSGITAPNEPLVSATTFTSVNITSMGTSPLELLPAPPVGQYYNVKYYDFKFNGTLYNNLDFNHFLQISQAGIPSAGINRTLIIYPSFGSTTAQKYVRVYPGTGLLETVTQALYVQPNDIANSGEITLKMAKATSPFYANPTGGGGTLEVTVTYTLETF